MMAIFNFFGSIFGYVLWPIFYVVQNYGIAIIIFAILAKIVLFPFSIKQQKAMANNARLQKKQKEIQEKYKNNKVKANEEMQKLYQKEGVNPSSGCLTGIIVPLSKPTTVLTSNSAPIKANRSCRVSKVSESAISVSAVSNISPVSIPISIC